MAQRVPYPPDRGDKITTFHEIRHLARKHEVHVYCLADGEEDLDNRGGLNGSAASVHAVAVDPFRAKLRGIAALADGRPLSVAMLAEPALMRAIAQGVRTQRPDAILVYSSNVAQFAEPFADIPRIMQFADLDSLKWQALAQKAVLPMRLIYALEARRLLAYERRIAAAFAHSLVCTPNEEADFRRLIPGAKLSVVGNGVDLDYFRPAGAAKAPASLVFTGVMEYAPNVDAVCWFCAEILPLVRREVPQASLTICGSRPAKEVRQLARIDGVTVTGWVPDVRPFLDRSTVFVAPLRIARGIQNKVLEAMATGLPVVCTARTWRGTTIPQGAGILVADTAVDFAREIVRLLRDDDLRFRMSSAARAAVEARYAWDAQLAALDRVLAEATEGTAGLTAPHSA
ncbi:MAG TPA: TIGR03087 family PEP-CTERM/XrtA system glycosyltransferase [Acetobacteraceae bacterium]|nr:TIGR03087 family PEP-CTERM/XrtA system glycosyltransferase [Acetobacteraceae bacterium]